MGHEETALASTDVTQPRLTERIGHGVPPTGTRDGFAAIAYTSIATGVLGALIYATVEGVSSWAHVVVLAGIALAAIGVMIAIDPLNRG
jgi:hypothetical protein